MYCTVCGNQISQGQCFCAVCGSKCLPAKSGTIGTFLESQEKEHVPSFAEFLQNRNSEFSRVNEVKTAERRDRFKPKRKKAKGVDKVKVGAT